MLHWGCIGTKGDERLLFVNCKVKKWKWSEWEEEKIPVAVEMECIVTDSWLLPQLVAATVLDSNTLFIACGSIVEHNIE